MESNNEKGGGVRAKLVTMERKKERGEEEINEEEWSSYGYGLPKIVVLIRLKRILFYKIIHELIHCDTDEIR